MAKNCAFDNCTRSVYSNKYCKLHQWARYSESIRGQEAEPYPIALNRNTVASGAKRPVRNTIKPIAKHSEKRKKINASRYEPEAREFRRLEGRCTICPILASAGIKTYCSGEAEAIHHVKGKATIELLLDKAFWMVCCFWSNNWIEANTATAFKLGLKLPDYDSKLSKFKK